MQHLFWYELIFFMLNSMLCVVLNTWWSAKQGQAELLKSHYKPTQEPLKAPGCSFVRGRLNRNTGPRNWLGG